MWGATIKKQGRDDSMLGAWLLPDSPPQVQGFHNFAKLVLYYIKNLN
jgi:hypothetical protein